MYSLSIVNAVLILNNLLLLLLFPIERLQQQQIVPHVPAV